MNFDGGFLWFAHRISPLMACFLILSNSRGLKNACRLIVANSP
jgi:hypothetical protein